jgi:S1-C subfamily serine protease
MKPAGLQVTVAERVARAVVRLPRLIGQGVLVPGGFIVTAARCIGWTADDSMMLGGLPEPVITADGRKIVAAPLAVEPVADLAVLGAMDDQAFSREAAAFAAFCDATPPVRLAIDTLKAFVPLPANVLTHDRGVIVPATVRTVHAGSASLWLNSDYRISRGTSGSPVVTEDGRLWGIISTIGAGPEEEPCQGFIPRVHLAGPAWLVRQMVSTDAWGRLGAAQPPCGRIRLQRRSRNR